MLFLDNSMQIIEQYGADYPAIYPLLHQHPTFFLQQSYANIHPIRSYSSIHLKPLAGTRNSLNQPFSKKVGQKVVVLSEKHYL
jgi:hypothetical protein